MQNLLRIKFPNTFGFPKPFYQLSEVREMISIMEKSPPIQKGREVTCKFNIADDYPFIPKQVSYETLPKNIKKMVDDIFPLKV